MKIKVTVLVMMVSMFCIASGRSGLLRTPKVYNAVITTDENLTPSRAFPVVQPVVHETGYAYPFGAFGPFGLYNALNSYPGYYQPQPASADSNSAPLEGRNTFYAGRDSQPQLQETPIETLPGAKPFAEPNLPLREAPLPEVISEPNNSIAPKAPKGPRPNYEDRPADAKAPIQLNEFGFPPSLIPLQSYNSNTQPAQPFNFNGYPYNFPVLYDSFGNYNSAQYPSVLPPFGYFPQLNQPNPYFAANIPQNQLPGGGAPAAQQITRNGRLQQIQNTPEGNIQDATGGNTEAAPDSPTTAAAIEATDAASTEQNDQEVAPTMAGLSENIKNNGNTNRDIPDVPPPPIPSGAKKGEQ